MLIMLPEFIFSGCESGTDFENKTVEFLRTCKFNANRVGNNDCGIDIIATRDLGDGKELKFLVQCKYYNKPLGKHPIQEVYAGANYYNNEGKPVVITNNRVTPEARIFVNRLGVEIIADLEWEEILGTIKTKTNDNPNIHHGLTGIIIAQITKNFEYFKQAITEPEEVEPTDNEDLILKIKDDFDQAEEYMKESAALQMKAAMYSQKAMNLQRDAIIKNLKYG